MYLPVVGRYFTLIVPEGKEIGTYSASLYSMNSHHLFISHPLQADTRSPITLSPGTKVILDYRDVKDIPCRFESIVDELTDAGQNLLAIRCPDVIERHQRRENVRIPVAWPVIIMTPSQTIQATLNDLSGGGFSAWVPSQVRIEPHEPVEVRFVINLGKEPLDIKANAEIISAQSDEEDLKQYLCSAKFSFMEETIRQRIIDFVFERQILDVTLRNVGRSIVF